MTEPATDTDTESLGSRLRERLGSISPFSLAMLGFIGVLGNLFPQLEVLQLFHLFWLLMLWPFVSMLIGSIRQSLGYERDVAGPHDWLEMDDGWRAQFAFLLGLPLSVVNPLMGRQDVMQLLGSVVAVVRHQGSLPDPTSFAQSTKFRLPVEGTWTVVNGSPIKEYSHSWFPATQRYAYDFVITDDEGRSRPKGTDTNIENYYCYDRPVLAPADGIVVDIHDSDPELGRAGGFSHPLKRSITGNRVTIRHTEGEYSSLVHLVPGSIEVEPGERVERGEQIGRCGHSGNSSEPHLHFQLQDHPTFEVAAGLPVRFDDVAMDTPGVDVAEVTGWDEPDRGPGRSIHVGQRVSHAPDREPPKSVDAADTPNMEVTPGLNSVRTLARVTNGLAVGGFATVLAGFVVSSLSTIALGLAGFAGLGIAYLIGSKLFNGDRTRPGTLGTIGGVGVAAALVGVFGTVNMLPEFGSVAIGAGVFVTGFVLYIAVWEYVRWDLFRDNGLANTTVN